MTPIQTIAHYRISSKLGEGGMGEVWRATDTKLGREVAIKILPEAVGQDPDRMARFTREAHVLASLNHPHIAQIYGVEDRALIMELVEGPTLAERIDAGPIPLAEAVPIARQIAEALECAHERGVVHRDLKPANIKVKPEGQVKVLDFGLAAVAQASTPEATDPMASPTLTIQATMPGVILGTAAYMSPEQASGKAVDKRADIWSFGVVLWEMLTGRRLFGGETVSHTLADVLRAEIDLSKLPAGTPAAIRQLLRRCLDRNVRNRLRDIGEARVVLGLPVEEEAPAAPDGSPRRSAMAAWIVAAAALLVAAGLAWILFRETPVAPLLRTELTLPPGVAPRYGSLSPDGTRMVTEGIARDGRSQLYLRPLAAAAFTPIPGTEGVNYMFWSPDSHWIAFGSNGQLMKWNVTAGQPPQVVCNANATEGTWSPDGVILFREEGKPVQRVPETGGVPRNALELDSAFGEVSHAGLWFLPGGKAFIFGSNGRVVGAQFFATLDGKVRRHLFDGTNSPPRYVANPAGGGFFAYVQGGQLFVRPFDPVRGEFTGEAVLLVDGVTSGPAFSFGGTRYLAYVPAASTSRQLRWYGRDGKPGETVGEGGLAQSGISPDGKRVMALKRDPRKTEIWLIDVARGTSERIATAAMIPAALWTPEGHILYSRSDAQGPVLIERPADALAAESVVARFPGNVAPYVQSISADGKLIAVVVGGGGSHRVFVISRHEGKIRSGRDDFNSVSLSPDGRWLALSLPPPSDRIVVQAIPPDPNAPLPEGTREIGSFASSPSQLRWSADAKELLVLTRDGMFSLPVDWSDGTPRSGAPRKLFDIPRAVGFDATADGRRFLVSESVGDATNRPITLIENWPALLVR
jgi:eukaryotic-like serine/threonine-protein kinase